MKSTCSLLLLLESAVKADAGPPGFLGKIGVGLLDGSKATWWSARFEGAARVATDLAQGRAPDDCDVVALIGKREADRLLSGETPSRTAKIFELLGNSQLFAQFVQRYLQRHNVLTFRTTSPKFPRGTTR